VSRRGLCSCALLALTVVVNAATARAQPKVTLSVAGACPSADAVRTALVKEKIAVSQNPNAPWLLSVATHLNGARLIISQDGTETTITREVFSNDCDAIADTFALITATYVRARGSKPPAQRVPVKRVVPYDPASFDPDAVAGITPPRETPITQRPARSRWRLGLAAGFNSTFGPDARAGFGQLDVGFERADGWGARIAFTQDGTAEYPSWQVLRRTETAANVSLTRTMAGKRLWWRPAIGAGAAISTVDVASVGTATRLLPTLTGSLAAGVRMTDRVSLRAELGLRIFPIADTYTSATHGIVGKSPRGATSLSIGVQIR